MSEVPEGYTFDKLIGKGAFGEVYLTSKKGTNEKFATKKMDKSLVLRDKVKKYFNNEIFILKQVNHPNIIKLVDLKTGINCFFLIFEVCNGGCLSDILEKYKEKYNKPFSQEIVQYLMRQIISGFAYLHDMKILHRDVKLDNILINFPTEADKQNLNLLNCQVKIIDFGFARYLKSDTLAKSLLGNPINMDPHILRKMNKMDNTQNFGYDQKADIWSLGCICYEMLIGTPAFDATSMDELCMKIQKGDYKIPHDIILSYEAISFLNGMMQYDPQRRLDIHQLASQYFLTKDVKTFHPVQMKKSKMDLGQSIILNSKETNPVLSAFELQGLDKISPEDYWDKEKSIAEKKNYRGIVEDQIDILGKMDELQKINEKNHISDSTNKIQEGNEKVGKELDGFLQDVFDKMNRDTFYVEPLIIPTKPLDNINNIDPASKFIDDI